MRIVGGRDYYDSALSYGHDPSLVFVRGETLLTAEDATRCGLYPSHLPGALTAAGEGGDRSASRRREFRRPETASTKRTRIRGTEYSLSFPTVIVAGMRRQGIRAEISHLFRDAGAQASVTYCWTEQQFTQWLGQHHLAYGDSDADLRAYFEPARLQAAAREMVVEHRWTILVHDPGGDWFHVSRAWSRVPWHVDQPVLRHVGFARAVPPHLLFQEIEMWLGGVLAAVGKPLIRVSDTDRAAKHGMDHTSFRRPPSKKR
jgi:hypothetical protein